MSELNGMPSCKTCGRNMDQTNAGTFYCPVSHMNQGQAVAELRDEVASLKSIVASLRSGTIDSCAACGMPFTHEINVIDHIQQCSKHPIGVLQKELDALHARLAFFDREWKPEDVTEKEVKWIEGQSDDLMHTKLFIVACWQRLVAKSKEPQ